MASRRNSHTRSYRNTRSRNGRRRNTSSGGGGSLLIFIGMILIGMYLFTNDKAMAKAKDLVQTAKETFIEQTTTSDPTLPVTVTPCTQAHIAKILVYTLFDLAEMPTTGIGESWYVKYYEMLEKDERFTFFKEENAMKPITYSETLDILKDIVGDSYQVSIKQSEEMGKQVIALKDFLLAYEQALNFGKIDHGLTYEDLSVLGTLTTNKALSAWQVATDKGIYGFEGLILDPFKDYTLKVVSKKGEILGVVETVSDQSVVGQCYIKSVEDGKATIQVGALSFDYEAPSLSAKDVGSIGRIVIKNSQIIDFELQLDKDTDSVLRIDEKTIEFQKAGTLPYDKVLVYNGIEDGNYTSLSQLFSGVKVSYTMKDGKVETIKVVDDKVNGTMPMRVVLTEDGVNSYNHSDIIITSETPYTVTYNGEVTEMAAGSTWEASNFSWEKLKGKVTVQPQANSKLCVQSMTRKGVHPEYNGNLEIYQTGDTYQLVNEVGLEDYIAGVIPSEMPTSYGQEAAKVQAVAARSFALSHAQSSKFMKYGAQVDDTVSTQVYNSVAPDEASYKAAQETAGEVVTHNNKMIDGKFFATSCGYTANFGETWANGEIFPTNTPVYLVSRQQYLGDRVVENLTDEKNAYAFFTKKPEEINAFDSKSPWFRWQLKVSGEELTQMVNNNINKLTTQYPNMVKVKNQHDQWVVDEIESVGNIKDMKVMKRGVGGNIMELVIEGDEKSVKVSTEYLIRSLLAPIQMDSNKEPIQIVRADGTTVDNMAMLPSAFFSMDMSYDANHKLTDTTLYGGGFGHGVGMSQDGVKGMVEMGYTYKEILKHYYGGAEIRKL